MMSERAQRCQNNVIISYTTFKHCLFVVKLYIIAVSAYDEISIARFPPKKVL